MNKTYEPHPLDTSGVQLDPDLLALIETIASNVHDIWDAGRISEGYTYGPVKDTATKTTPLLVPYQDLPESEKDYDRKTAMESIKMVLKLGYKIVKDE